MGIRGLMTYLRKYPNLLEHHFLHGEYLVIDGHSLAAKLYESGPGNTVFGGDYDSYAPMVEIFFDELQKCDVEPLVILDSKSKIKNIKKFIDRKKKKLEKLIDFTPATENRMEIVPLSAMIVFKSILEKKGVKVVRCLGKDDPSTAGVAKALNCPVLTFNSEFFTYGVQCVPIDSLKPSIIKYSSNEGSFAKECKIFKPEVLSKLFRGFSISMFPFLTILLGKTYVESTIFENFFNSLRYPTNKPSRLYSEEQRKIEATLLWLSYHNVHEAIAALLEKIPKNDREDVKKIMENVIDEHLNLPCDLLKTFGFNENYEIAMRANSDYKKFKFLGEINEQKEKTCQEKKTCESENPDEEKTEETETNIEIYNQGCCKEEIINSWPSWFIRELEAAKTPSYCVELMIHRFFYVPIRVEKWSCPSVMNMSLKIVRVIDGLLVAGREESSCKLMLLTRDGKEIITRLIDTLHGTKTTKFPSLTELRETPMKIRKQIFEDTLEMSSNEIEDLPDKWKLYVAVILFWMRQNDEPSRNSRHMQAVIFTMLLGVIDEKIGYQRSLYTLTAQQAKEIVEIEQDCEALEIKTKQQGSIKDALKKVTESDCLNAASFFIKNYCMDPQLRIGAKQFNVTAVHVFMQFEACLKHAIELNKLLECPYEPPKIEELLNQTMIFNLYEKFKSELNVRDLIARILKKAPSLLHLVDLLNAKAQKILDNEIESFID